MTLLSTLQDVAAAVGLTKPSQIVGNNSEDARRLLVEAGNEGRILSRGGIYNEAGSLITQHDWTALRKEQVFSLAENQPDYDLSKIIDDNDYVRLVENTFWDRSNDRRVHGVTPQEWQLIKSDVTAASEFNRKIILRGGSLFFEPVPSDSAQIAFEYVSNKWCESSIGTAQTGWLADTDTFKLDEHLLFLGVRFRYLRSVGAPYNEEQKEYLDEVIVAASTDKVPTRTYIGKPMVEEHPNIPDSGYG